MNRLEKFPVRRLICTLLPNPPFHDRDDFLLSSPLPLAPIPLYGDPAERYFAAAGGPSPLHSAACACSPASLRLPSSNSIYSLTSQPSAVSGPSASTVQYPIPSIASGPYGSRGAAASAPLWTLQQLIASCEPEPHKAPGRPAPFRFPPPGSRNVSGGAPVPGSTHVPGGMTFPGPTEAPGGMSVSRGMSSRGVPNAWRGVRHPGGAPWRFHGDFDGASSPWQPVQLEAGIWTVTGDSWGPAVHPSELSFRAA